MTGLGRRRRSRAQTALRDSCTSTGYAQRKRNFQLSHLAKAIRGIYPSADVVPHRVSATLVVSQQEILQVSYVDATHGVEIFWKDGAATAGLDEEQVLAACAAATAEGPERGPCRG